MYRFSIPSGPLVAPHENQLVKVSERTVRSIAELVKYEESVFIVSQPTILALRHVNGNVAPVARIDSSRVKG